MAYGVYGVELNATSLQRIVEEDSDLYCKCDTATRLCAAVFRWAQMLVDEQRGKHFVKAAETIDFEVHQLIEYLCEVLLINHNPCFAIQLNAEAEEESAKKAMIEMAVYFSVQIAKECMMCCPIDIGDIMRSYSHKF